MRLLGTIGVAFIAYLIDLATLYLLFKAFNFPITVGPLVAGLAVGILFWTVSITPQGIGVVEGMMALTFTSRLAILERFSPLAVLGISAASHLIKGLDYEEASLAGGLMVVLGLMRAHFHARSDRPSAQQGLRVLAGALPSRWLTASADFTCLTGITASTSGSWTRSARPW